MADQAFGMVIGAGGADVIIRAMTGVIKAKGGEIRLKSPVARIESGASGRATGVTLGDGTRIAAKKAAIANLNPQIVFGRLMNLIRNGRPSTIRSPASGRVPAR